MRTSSAKSKGRRLQNWTAEQVADVLGLEWGKDEQVAPREMGQAGADIRLVADAKELFPWCIECKNQESWNVHSYIKQARATRDKDMPDADWLVIAKRNRADPVAILDAEVFFELLDQIKGVKGRKRQ